MPCWLACVPRTMLPPPITRPMSTPSPCSDWISSVSRSTTGGEMPKPCSPASASPESFSTTRLYFRSSAVITRRSLAQLVADEAAHHHVLARLRRGFLHQLADRLLARRVLHEDLVHERLLLVEPAQLTLDDLLVHVLRLALLPDLLQVHGALALHHLGRDLFRRDGQRVHRSDMHGEVAGELLERLIARYEVRLALHLDQHAEAAVRVDIAADRALARLPLCALRSLRRTLRAQQVDRRLNVAVRLFQRLLALHHPRTRPLAELLHLSRTDRRRHVPSPYGSDPPG